ncbi:MAG: 4'-phosphopantetheinyl transferase superfamily protein [Lachnospiraceae bacterium]|nr:4'-phosphopantetheinyl transferase superfamily protein [Lachnospiraceae bacterium]
MNTEKLDHENYFWEHYEKLSQERRRKIDGYHFRKDKNLSLGAGILLDRGLSDYGLREKQAVIQHGKYGKPYLLNDPQIHFNLSHSGQMVLAVFSQTEVGCDIEWIGEGEEELAQKFFCSEEYDYIKGQPEGVKRSQAFYRIWTLKESFLKASGLGLGLSLDAFEIIIDSDGSPRVSQKIDQGTYEFWEWCFGETAQGGYRGAVCQRWEKSF